MNGTLPSVLTELGVTQLEIATALDVSQATVNRKLKGLFDWKLEEGHAVVRYLSENYDGDFDVHELFGLKR